MSDDLKRLRQIAELCNITIAQMRLHVNKHGAPNVFEKEENAREFIKWYIKFVAENTTVGKLAAMSGRTERQIDNWANDKIIPRTDRGVYPLVECVRAIIAKLNERIYELENLTDTEEKINRQKLLKLEIQNAKLQSHIIAIEDLQRIMAMYNNETGKHLRLIQRQAPAELQQIVKEFVEETAHELAGIPEQLSADIGEMKTTETVQKKTAKRK